MLKRLSTIWNKYSESIATSFIASGVILIILSIAGIITIVIVKNIIPLFVLGAIALILGLILEKVRTYYGQKEEKK
jgi:xanthine/uracil permease